MTCQLRIVMTIKIATKPFPLFHILESHRISKRFYVLLLNKVRLLGRLCLWGFWGVGILLLFHTKRFDRRANTSSENMISQPQKATFRFHINCSNHNPVMIKRQSRMTLPLMIKKFFLRYDISQKQYGPPAKLMMSEPIIVVPSVKVPVM